MCVCVWIEKCLQQITQKQYEKQKQQENKIKMEIILSSYSVISALHI